MSKIHCVGAYQVRASVPPLAETQGFNGHPPLGVNATSVEAGDLLRLSRACFNGHPPLGVNATFFEYEGEYDPRSCMFQRAPTLGGECYPELRALLKTPTVYVSMGTHPWG